MPSEWPGVQNVTTSCAVTGPLPDVVPLGPLQWVPGASLPLVVSWPTVVSWAAELVVCVTGKVVFVSWSVTLWGGLVRVCRFSGERNDSSNNFTSTCLMKAVFDSDVPARIASVSASCSTSS